jgi:hypothetical protein
MLAANVSYLAIQSIDSEEPNYRSPVQVGCYLSIIASIGSIFIGLHMQRQNRWDISLDRVVRAFKMPIGL